MFSLEPTWLKVLLIPDINILKLNSDDGMPASICKRLWTYGSLFEKCTEIRAFKCKAPYVLISAVTSERHIMLRCTSKLISLYEFLKLNAPLNNFSDQSRLLTKQENAKINSLNI
jgi:hypothetical protein